MISTGLEETLVVVCIYTGLPSGSDSKETGLQCRRPRFDPWVGKNLEKEMATHSSILAWRIPWTEKGGRLQSMGSQRVRHNRVTDTVYIHVAHVFSMFTQIHVFLYAYKYVSKDTEERVFFTL